jgi:hypothetical protein
MRGFHSVDTMCDEATRIREGKTRASTGECRKLKSTLLNAYRLTNACCKRDTCSSHSIRLYRDEKVDLYARTQTENKSLFVKKRHASMPTTAALLADHQCGRLDSLQRLGSFNGKIFVGNRFVNAHYRVLPNSSWFSSFPITQKRSKSMQLRLALNRHSFPAYSPRLNPVESVFAVVTCTIDALASIIELIASVTQFLGNCFSNFMSSALLGRSSARAGEEPQKCASVRGRARDRKGDGKLRRVYYISIYMHTKCGFQWHCPPSASESREK